MLPGAGVTGSVAPSLEWDRWSRLTFAGRRLIPADRLQVAGVLTFASHRGWPVKGQKPSHLPALSSCQFKGFSFWLRPTSLPDRYKEKLKLLLSDYQVKAEPWLFEHRGKPIVNEAIGDLRERLAEAVPSLLYRVGSPYHQSGARHDPAPGFA